MEHVIHWLLTNVQRVMALVDPGDECSLVHGKPEQFPGRSTYIDGYGAQSIEVEAVSLPLEIGQLPVRVYIVYVSPILEYILGIDVLQGLVLQTSVEEFCLQVCVVKAVVRGYAEHPPQMLPTPWRVETVRQYRRPGDHKEIGTTIAELVKVDMYVLYRAHSTPCVVHPEAQWLLADDCRLQGTG